jgi:hypothetical protein
MTEIKIFEAIKNGSKNDIIKLCKDVSFWEFLDDSSNTGI